MWGFLCVVVVLLFSFVVLFWGEGVYTVINKVDHQEKFVLLILMIKMYTIPRIPLALCTRYRDMYDDVGSDNWYDDDVVLYRVYSNLYQRSQYPAL